MSVKKEQQIPDINTEEKIKAAARNVFHKKGFAATRTRDIAEEANINLALLNYYFRSKQKLFDLIMLETAAAFLQNMGTIFNDENSTLKEKIVLVAEKYIDLLIEEPEIPVFFMSEVRGHGAAILDKLPIVGGILQSAFLRQYNEAVVNEEVNEPEPLHFLMNILGLVVFPFVNSPLLKKVGNVTNARFDDLMRDRKEMIPVWMDAMFKSNGI